MRGTLGEGKALRRWMAMVFELHSREVLHDLRGEYLRALRPYVHRGTGFSERVVRLIDHMDWLETAFQPSAFAQVAFGQPVVLVELTPPSGCEFMRLQLQRSPATSVEGEMFLTLTLRRSAELQRDAQAIDAAVLAFSRFHIDGTPCLVIGGVRGQRHPVHRVSAPEIAAALHGWKPAVLLVRVAQELAGHWHLRLVGLDPAAHRLHGWSYRLRARYREAGEKVFASYRALWEHFGASNGPRGWVILPLQSNENLAATALSPEKRARQARRADFWLRTRGLLRLEMRKLLQGREPEAPQGPATEQLAPPGRALLDIFDPGRVPLRVLETGPAALDG